MTANLLRWDEAMSLLNAEQDPIVKQFLGRTFQIVIGLSEEKREHQDFDLRLCFEIVRELAQQKDALRRILSGEDLSESW